MPIHFRSRVILLLATAVVYSLTNTSTPASAPSHPQTPGLRGTPSTGVGAAAKASRPKQIRTRRGHFARITYPRTTITTTPIQVDVTLRHLHGKAPRRVYHRIRLVGLVTGGTWKPVRTVLPRTTHLTFRVVAPATPGRYRLRFELTRPGRSNITTPPVSVIVRDPSHYAPRGDSNDWSSISGKNLDGTTVRWDPCLPIRWAFNPNGTATIYPQARDDLTTTMARISARTGLRFEYVGVSDRVPFKSTDSITNDDDMTADLFIAFADKYEVNTFEVAIGLGGPIYYHRDNTDTLWVDTAGVLLDSTMATKHNRDSSSRDAMISLMTHELLHAIGLGHAQGNTQVMYPYLRPTGRFGAGDITGMNIHGATNGCAPGYPEKTKVGYPARATVPHRPPAPYRDRVRDTR